MLIGGFYRPPSSNIEYYNLLIESIDCALNTNINDVIITGDFNYNMLSNDSNKMNDLLQLYNLKQLITEETHFTEISASLIDLIMAGNTNNIVYSGVADPFIPDQVCYHCPVILLLKFVRPSLKSYTRKIWIYSQADFDKYRELLTDYHLEIAAQQADIVQITQAAILEAAEKSTPNKLVVIRPNDYPWITCFIKSLIRKRRRLYRKFKKTNKMHHWIRFKALRNKVVNHVRKSKTEWQA